MEDLFKFRAAHGEQPCCGLRTLRHRRAPTFPSRFNSLARWLFVGCTVLSLVSCRKNQPNLNVGRPAITFTDVPTLGQNDALGNAAEVSTIKGRVIGAEPGEQIVLYARAINNYGQLTWFVQPFVRQPFTKIDADSTWRSATHPGSEYAALLVKPGFQPPWTSVSLPKDGVVAVAITKGWPPVWRSWWFPFVCVLVCVAVIMGLHRLRLLQISRKLNQRFEERLAERTRVAQELHDTLLQGLLSASMQLHVAVDHLPEDDRARAPLNRVLQMMKQIIDEGRNTVRGLRSSPDGVHDLAASLSRVPRELGHQPKEVEFQVIVDGTSLPLRPVIRDEVYSIGREALVNAFRHSQASNIAVQLEYATRFLRVVVRDDGHGIDARVLEFGRDGHFGLSGMRERSERIGSTFRIRSRLGNGTEVELRVPSNVAYESGSSDWASKIFKLFYERPAVGEQLSKKRAG